MLWFLMLHIMALLVWCGALLYLPALIAAQQHHNLAFLSKPRNRRSMARFLFTNIASPSGLITIIAGTAVFLINDTTEVWLFVKLTLVTGLVIAHTLTGLLLLRITNKPDKPVFLWCWLLEIVFLALMIAIIWIVLAKPHPGVFL